MRSRVAGTDRRFERLWIPSDDFPHWLRKHRESDPDTPMVEQLGVELIASDFAPDRVPEFVRRVCGWGNYAGVGGRVLRRNMPGQLAKAFREAHQLSVGPTPEDALQPILSLKGLNVSFGSKHLKFLNPERAVVLDSIISEKLGYPRDLLGYGDLLADCFALLEQLRQDATPYPFPPGTWRVSDVEMAIYQRWK
ncbi:hypothetical protein [Falsiroseomonas sp.]|uniref:hypothetical protein n=1 Tax=Falsiroseomonas sp. TaxID=2870721 RepID=UPI003F7200B2